MEEKKGILAQIVNKLGVFHHHKTFTPPVTPKHQGVEQHSPLSKTETKTPTSTHSNPMQNTPSSTASGGPLEASGIKQNQFRRSRSSSAPLISSFGAKGMERLEGDTNESVSYVDPTKFETDSDDGYDSTEESAAVVQIHVTTTLG